MGHIPHGNFLYLRHTPSLSKKTGEISGAVTTKLTRLLMIALRLETELYTC
jgi:hypothetical protein